MIGFKARNKLEAAEQRILLTQNGSFRSIEVAKAQSLRASTKMMRRVIARWGHNNARACIADWHAKLELRAGLARRCHRRSLTMLDQV